jgi:stress-induced morphogen
MKIGNTTELTKFKKKKVQLQIEIQPVALKITS